ncbi:hypothetical protein GCM10022293_15510 [Azospirillum formosense]
MLEQPAAWTGGAGSWRDGIVYPWTSRLGDRLQKRIIAQPAGEWIEGPWADVAVGKRPDPFPPGVVGCHGDPVQVLQPRPFADLLMQRPEPLLEASALLHPRIFTETIDETAYCHLPHLAQ